MEKILLERSARQGGCTVVSRPVSEGHITYRGKRLPVQRLSCDSRQTKQMTSGIREHFDFVAWVPAL